MCVNIVCINIVRVCVCIHIVRVCVCADLSPIPGTDKLMGCP